ncbi:MAG: glutathione S-transferase family protein [Pseudomonadota bacterium]
MAIKLYDLAAADPAIRFSPNCWRARMALAHKGLAVETIPWRFTDKQVIAFSDQGRTPVIVDGDRWVVDSWSIAEYLDEVYPDKPLFNCAQSKAYCVFFRNWIDRVVNPGIVKQIIVPLFGFLAEEDQPYFRESREKMFGKTLEDFGAGAAEALPAFRASLTPLRLTLERQSFIAGDEPAFADYLGFGAFQWARTSAPHDLLESEDPIYAWRERMLDRFEGLGRAMPARAA